MIAGIVVVVFILLVLSLLGVPLKFAWQLTQLGFMLALLYVLIKIF